MCGNHPANFFLELYHFYLQFDVSFIKELVKKLFKMSPAFNKLPLVTAGFV